MTSALTTNISSATSTSYSGGELSFSSLQAQLQSYQKQLSDCVNCASAKTLQGKADIQAIASCISQIEQRITQKENAHTNPSSVTQLTPAPIASTTPGYGGLINVLA